MGRGVGRGNGFAFADGTESAVLDRLRALEEAVRGLQK
jgi:hypothetical protein